MEGFHLNTVIAMLSALIVASCGNSQECTTYEAQEVASWKTGAMLGRPGVGQYVTEVQLICVEWK
jgi:hypothetical protein